MLQVNFRQLQKQRARFTHDALLHIEIGQPFQGLDFFRCQLGDALINRDGLGQKSVANEDLRQPLEIFDGLKRLTLANVQFADGHQGDLILRLVFQDVLILRDGLGDLALVQQFLRGFDVFALVIGHA